VVLRADTQQLLLGQHLQVMEDKSGRLTFTQVAAADASFSPSRQLVPNFGFSRSVWWFRVRLLNQHPSQQAWLLENSYPCRITLTCICVAPMAVLRMSPAGARCHLPAGRWCIRT
jgi:hypothetical protein